MKFPFDLFSELGGTSFDIRSLQCSGVSALPDFLLLCAAVCVCVYLTLWVYSENKNISFVVAHNYHITAVAHALNKMYNAQRRLRGCKKVNELLL